MNMKNILILLFASITLITACKKNKPEIKATDREITVGIAKLIAHPALDLIEQGVIDELNAQGYTKITFDKQNANGDIATNAEIANRFKNKDINVVVAITTATALGMSNQIKDKPIVFAGVTDPVGAGLRTTLAVENTNVTGISDMPPVADEIKMIQTVMPNVKKIGHIYTPGEPNSVTQMKIIQEITDSLGIELLLSPVNNSAEVKQAANILAPKVDAIFVSKDNFVVAALNSVTTTAMKYNIPVFSADPSSAANAEVLLAYGIDSYKTGRTAGKVVARILAGEKPESIPVLPPEELVTYVNLDVANKLGITIPDNIIKQANNK